MESVQQVEDIKIDPDENIFFELDDICDTAELDVYLDEQIQKLNVEDEINKSVNGLRTQIIQQQHKQWEIREVFDECHNLIEKYKNDMDDEFKKQNGEPTVIPSGSEANDDDDDDVQFVDANFDTEALKAKRLVAEQARQTRMAQQSASTTTSPAIPRPPALTRAPAPGQAKNNSVSRMPNMTTANGQRHQPSLSKSPARQGPPKQVDLAVGMKLYGKKWNDVWYKGTLIEIQNKDKPLSDRKYKIKFDEKGVKVLSGKNIAFSDTPYEQLPVGSRVIALFHEEDSERKDFYAGIIAEPPSLRNGMRYLAFFDDGYAQYCSAQELHRVCEQSKNVWDDIHPDSQDFIRSYLQQYPERPMVRLQEGQVVKTEWNGQWWIARVQGVDASLVKMYFDADRRIEWIYRGSTRLEPLYTELKNAEVSKTSGKGLRHNRTLNRNKKPFVEYTRGVNENSGKSKEQASTSQKRRSVARKSTGKVQPTHDAAKPAAKYAGKGPTAQDRFQSEMHEDDDLYGHRKPIPNLQNHPRPKRFVNHRCGERCLGGLDDPVKHKGANPLLFPHLCGWERQVAKQKHTYKKIIFYRSPCGRRLRNIKEVDDYLIQTNSKLTVDYFCFDSTLHTDMEFAPVKTFCDIKDLSYGKENVPISCVNGIDRQYPDYVDYSNVRTPAKGVVMNLDPDFLCGCDCTDGCRDPTKCACIQRTIEASKATPGGKADHTAGYKNRRIKNPLITGIYECNQRCNCNTRCHNRVAQNGLQLRLQVYKTEKRGWGLRCLDDIPEGGFICVYAGQILTEQGANEDGQQFGDEYLAELDYIEVVERNKEGYESDVNEDVGLGADEDYENTEPDSDSDYYDTHKPKRKSRGTKRSAPITPDRGGSQGQSGQENSPSRTHKMQLPQRTGVTPQSTLRKKTEDWVNSLPDEDIIILEDSDEELPCQTDGTFDPVDFRHSSQLLAIGQTDGAGDEKSEEESSNGATKNKRKGSSSKRSDLGEGAAEGIAGLVITEPTSLNIDNVEEEDEGVEQGEVEYPGQAAPNLRRTTRSQTTRFSQLPDPKSKKEISPLKRNTADDDAEEEVTSEKDHTYTFNTREYFGEDQFCYVMDAKSMGNLGRYLNHSCSPNVFVQNVFVDTHDLRFPWVAFFASQYIRAGTELTWDYNYEVGSVPGKILYCYCGSAECRGRLL